MFFGGAGVSTASGIPDFRSADGLYHQHFAYPPEEMLSHGFFVSHTEEFYDFYRERMICLDARPNQAHRKLAELERDGRLAAVVTQNIDGLHQAAGSRVVHELHGSTHRNVCTRCGETYAAEWVMAGDGVPHCEKCGGLVKPDVVLYGEPLDERVIGSVAMEDPSTSARGLAHLAGIVSGLSTRGADAPWEYVRELLAGGALVSAKDVLDAPGREERAVALTSEQRLMQAHLLEPPAPESVYPVEGACVTCGCTAIVSGCANLRQARAWVDFVTGRACQERLAAEALARPARSDVAEPEGLPDADDPIVPDRAGLLVTWSRVLDGTWEPSEVAPEDAANAQ